MTKKHSFLKFLFFTPLLFFACLVPFMEFGEKITLHPLHVAMPGFFTLAAVCFFAKGPKFVLYSVSFLLLLYAVLLVLAFSVQGFRLSLLSLVFVCIICIAENIRNIKKIKS